MASPENFPPEPPGNSPPEIQVEADGHSRLLARVRSAGQESGLGNGAIERIETSLKSAAALVDLLDLFRAALGGG
jgi:hypothetical protein